MTTRRHRGRRPRSRRVSVWDGVWRALLLGALLLLAPVIARAQASDSLVLRWTAPADPGVGTVTRYDVRVSNVIITRTNFTSATAVPAGTPGAPGTLERLVVHGLQAGQTYWLAIRSADAVGNWSAVSNVVRWDGTLDTSPPAAPQSLAALAPLGAGAITLSWAPGTEPDLAGYRVWRAPDPSGPWVNVGTVSSVDTTFDDTSPPPGVAKLWYAVTAFDGSGNQSARSAEVAVVLPSAQSSRANVWRIDAPFPNPAHAGETMHVPIAVPTGAHEAHLDILDQANRLVRRLDVPAGSVATVHVDWDGTNGSGAPCAPGVYRAWLVAGSTRVFVRVARVP